MYVNEITIYLTMSYSTITCFKSSDIWSKMCVYLTQRSLYHLSCTWKSLAFPNDWIISSLCGLISFGSIDSFLIDGSLRCIQCEMRFGKFAQPSSCIRSLGVFDAWKFVDQATKWKRAFEIISSTLNWKAFV